MSFPPVDAVLRDAIPWMGMGVVIATVGMAVAISRWWKWGVIDRNIGVWRSVKAEARRVVAANKAKTTEERQRLIPVIACCFALIGSVWVLGGASLFWEAWYWWDLDPDSIVELDIYAMPGYWHQVKMDSPLATVTDRDLILSAVDGLERSTRLGVLGHEGFNDGYLVVLRHGEGGRQSLELTLASKSSRRPGRFTALYPSPGRLYDSPAFWEWVEEHVATNQTGP